MKKSIVPSATTLKAKRAIVNAKQESASTSAKSSHAKTASVPAKTTAKAPAPEREPKAGVNIGAKTGMRVMAFQDLILATNDLPRRPAPVASIPSHLTDTEIAKVWREEFPNSRAVLNGRIDESIVRGVRNLFNQGTGGHGTPGKTQSSQPYVLDAKGHRSTTAYTRARKGKEEAPAPAKAKAPVKASKPVAGKKVVVTRKPKAA